MARPPGNGRRRRRLHSVRLFQRGPRRATGDEPERWRRCVEGSCRHGSVGSDQESLGSLSSQRGKAGLRRFQARTFSWSSRPHPRSIGSTLSMTGANFVLEETILSTPKSGPERQLTFETLNVRNERAVLFVEISAPPMNLLGPELVRDLVSLIQLTEPKDAYQVLVFKSADPDYFISHVDVTRIKENRDAAAKLCGDASIGQLLRHLSLSRLAQIEGRVRGVGSE